MTLTGAGAIAPFPIDRAAEERRDPDLIDRLRADPATRVIALTGDRIPVRRDAAGALSLRLVSAAGLTASAWAFLGRGVDGTAVLVALTDDASGESAPLREIGGDLTPGEADAATTATALARWLYEHDFCPFCGTRAELQHAGWSRRCPACSREHFPRTDPAVIVAVVDRDDPDRLLLGSNAAWPAGRYSCFAGFAEAGESLEETVLREVAEEAGVELTELRYIGSQAWPYPRSLMLGFHAEARSAHTARADGEEIVEVRWFTRAEIGEALAGRHEITLPGAASIARRLITDWFEGRA